MSPRSKRLAFISPRSGRRSSARFDLGWVAGGHFANAYLFHGPAGVGKGTVAVDAP